jgi:hypothetical protein
MDFRTSYVRLLIGDNSRTAPQYTDEQIDEACTLGPDRPAFPIDLRLAGTLGAIHYPRGPAPGGGLSLATLSDAQLQSLTDSQLSALTD